MPTGKPTRLPDPTNVHVTAKWPRPEHPLLSPLDLEELRQARIAGVSTQILAERYGLTYRQVPLVLRDPDKYNLETYIKRDMEASEERERLIRENREANKRKRKELGYES